MLVIEGRAGKSRVLADKVEELIKQVDVPLIQIIDYVHIPNIFTRRFNYCTNSEDMPVENFPEHYRKYWKSFQFTTHLILSLNAPKEILDDIKAIEKDFNKEIIVTIQNNDLAEIRTYEY